MQETGVNCNRKILKTTGKIHQPFPLFISSRNALSPEVRSASSIRSGLFRKVLFRASRLRHFSIEAWLPERSTSGTVMPLNSSGLVYCGYSRSPAEKESDSLDPGSP